MDLTDCSRSCPIAVLCEMPGLLLPRKKNFSDYLVSILPRKSKQWKGFGGSHCNVKFLQCTKKVRWKDKHELQQNEATACKKIQFSQQRWSDKKLRRGARNRQQGYVGSDLRSR